MGKSLRLLTATAVILPITAVAVSFSGPATAGSPGGWKFEPTINAPWAQEGGDDDEGLDTPEAAVGLCRSAPFNTVTGYAPTTDVDAIVGDPVNNSGASNLGGVNITVTPVNDAPVVTAGADKTANENGTVSASATFTDVEAFDTHTCQFD